eukprot:56836-Rhodomonas_salina.2
MPTPESLTAVYMPPKSISCSALSTVRCPKALISGCPPWILTVPNAVSALALFRSYENTPLCTSAVNLCYHKVIM